MARNAASHRRPPPQQDAFSNVLVICEGIKTEPQYLNRLKVVYGLSNITVKHSGYTDPLNIVDVALAELKKADGWDRVYCVFDGDVEHNLAAARGKLANSDAAKAGKLFEVLSIPCVEFWFLLHFIYSAKAYTRTARKTPCESVLDDLKGHYPDYKKGEKNIFDFLQPKMNVAIGNAKRLIKDQAGTGATNPATRMHELIEYLTSMKKFA